MDEQGIFIGNGTARVWLDPAYANRHGLIAGATGTGKTVSLQVLAEGFSSLGVPVVLADVKGDLSGLSQAGAASTRLTERVATIGMAAPVFRGAPVMFWDVFGKGGHPLRTTISEMGPMLLARLLELNDTQTGILHVAFRVADDEGLLLLDMADLRALLAHCVANAKEISAAYGRINAASIGAIQRRLLTLEDQGAQAFFGEPALALSDLMRQDGEGRGMVSVIDARELFHRPALYSTVMLWLLSELFEELPEVGDSDRPRIVFFFDEAHLLFDDAPDALLDKVEQVVRLIRSKGVGVFFITQSPLDLPDPVLGQLGNRIQHALRAFTPRDQKAVRAAAQTFRQNPRVDTEAAITELGVGEALASMLEAKGVPGIVQRCLVRPPASRIGPATEEERERVMAASPVGSRYAEMINRESAYEILAARAEKAAEAQAREASGPSAGRRRASSRQGYVEATLKSALRSLGNQLGGRLGRELMRGVLGSLSRR
jgi:DNA helicase HerA-like ATPase